MPRNGSGNFSLPAINSPVVDGTLITASNFNAITADLSTAITNSIATNGESVITGNIPMAGFKLTGLGAGTAANDAATLSQIQSNASGLLTSVAGTNTITASLTPALAAYASGQLFTLTPANSTTGAVTININGLGAKDITKSGTNALETGDLLAGDSYLIEYDGTRFQLVTATNSGLIEHIATGTGAVARTVQSKLREIKHLTDFIGIDLTGATSSSTGFQAALDSFGTKGGCLELPNDGYIYLATSITIPRNVTIKGQSHSFGMPRYTYSDEHHTVSSIRLSNAATINFSNGSSICNVLIINNNLVSALPFANVTAGNAAVAAFAGTALSGNTAQDIYIHNVRILGFAQAIYTTLCDRQKIEYVDIDCTNGIWIDACYDIPRISNVHAWPFVSYGYAFTLVSNFWVRTGSCFKTTTHFDAGVFLNCFSYGWAIGFDIQAPTETQLIGCYADNYGGGANNSQIGFKISGATATQISMVDCGASAQDVGLVVNGAALVLSVTNCRFWGNRRHTLVSQCVNVKYNGCGFLNLNATWAYDYQFIIDGASGQVDINDCLFYGNSTYSSLYVANFSNVVKISDNSFSVVNAAITYAATMTAFSSIVGNSFVATTALTIPAGEASNKAVISNNIGLQVSQSYNNLTTSEYSFGGGNGIKNDKYYARGTAAAPTISLSGDGLGFQRFYGYDGTGFKIASAIRSQVDGAPAAGSMPGNILFSTTPSGTVSLVDRLALTNAGNLSPITDNAYTLGANGNRWSAVWAATGTIQTSDLRTKENIKDASLGLDFINNLRPVSYTWKQGGVEVLRQVYRDSEGNEVDSNIGGAIPAEIITKEKVGTRTHWGLIAQEVKQVIDDAGVDFAGWVLTDKDDADSQQALRYDQFISPLIKAVQELAERVKTLEAK